MNHKDCAYCLQMTGFPPGRKEIDQSILRIPLTTSKVNRGEYCYQHCVGVNFLMVITPPSQDPIPRRSGLPE